jgi:hypothetical protein
MVAVRRALPPAKWAAHALLYRRSHASDIARRAIATGTQRDVLARSGIGSGIREHIQLMIAVVRPRS